MYIYEATIKNEITGEMMAKVSSYSAEGLAEEMGKGKWTNPVKKIEDIEKAELIQEKIGNETIEDLMDDHDCETSQGEGCQVCCDLLPNYVE